MDNVHDGQPDASSEAEWAWAAGFFDGEGTIGVQRNFSKTCKNPSFSLHVKIAQNTTYPLEKIRALMNGQGSIHKFSRIRARKGKMMEETYYSYEVTGEASRRFLEKMLPFLTIKKERAEVGIEFRKIIEGRTNKGSQPLTKDQVMEGFTFYYHMKKLNRPPLVACSSND